MSITLHNACLVFDIENPLMLVVLYHGKLKSLCVSHDNDDNIYTLTDIKTYECDFEYDPNLLCDFVMWFDRTWSMPFFFNMLDMITTWADDIN